MVLTAGLTYAQQTKPLSIEDAVKLALENSTEIKISDSNVRTAESELNVIKNNQYPDFNISGQYMYLTNANIDLKLATGQDTAGEESGGGTPDVNQLMFGMATVQMPIFSGFSISNSIKAGKSNYEAEVLNAKNEKENIALMTINGYINLYKATKTIELLNENLKSAHQRVVDFTNMENNGLLAKNDRLKAELQEANFEIALEEAKKNKHIINYQLVTFLKLPEGTTIETTENTFGIAENNPDVQTSRYDIQAMEMQLKAAESQVKVAKGKYYPSIFFSGGYIAADVQNVVAINNAVNVGVGISYNIADIFKAKSDIKVAKSRASSLAYAIEQANDNVKIQIENAEQNYQLALKKLNVYTKSVEQAVENYRIVKDKYDNGLVDTNDLLEADVQQLQTKLDLEIAKADITKAYYELLNAQGQLTAKLN
ncbi:TolC family protein [Neptunitalea lumnitzerae]|uniref:Transporter n=1 Tax=Neptunitalea lumnitzerae TaxID=2965509 RepID=A0ABQ5MPK0_9FLAO|nr:TolC family protein [Neptunitalea sp. Y10]GLB50907.1 transporter [Neptunitalea sp. Y10]